ncbi:flavin-dependent dehydrogenase [Tahibacter aquaticus]|jgi:flavin-dependent dehydrogenase|uniref:Flavin-dependent dehydrogenase n=1 Tax=Tahibacter aquaticus TaxID=520092 RepID=A0A4R6Z7K0_9GAMM|nr:NAD(P)/FAD-dependent oxidoreductase [Tahibacter aquaticus]TDR47798.1 flavin-dependent dehydrogenase [Tahibacter aquaticus]
MDNNADGTITCDVLVVGGGPAGSTVATLMQRRGLKVLQLEKDHHPRFHIGESLLPANMPILDELGVMDEVRGIGMLKLGADFPEDGDNYRTYHFARSLGKTPPFAFQVKREDYDQILFRNAQRNGVDAREGVKVDKVEIQPDRSCHAFATAENGEKLAIRARYLVDASGRDTLLGNALKLKVKNQQHQSAAIFAHFKNVTRRPGEEAGNISIYRFDYGWSWFIPLSDGLMSIGCVCFPEYLKQRKGRTGEFLLETLKLMPGAVERMAEAEIVGEVRVTGNYSYTCSRMSGPGYIMVGDAFAFVDPVFSSGVYLAMHSGKHAAALVDAILKNPQQEFALQQDFEKRIRRGVRVFSWFIYRFNSPVMRSLFASPRNVLKVEQGVISMLAGDVFDSGPVMRRLHLFKAIYAATGLAQLRRWWADLRERRKQSATQFTGGNTPVDPL